MLLSTGKPYHFKRSKFRFKLAEDLIWQNTSGDIITVPAGFISDGASIPQPLRKLTSKLTDDPNDPINLAAYIHDYPFTNNHMLILNGELKKLKLSQLDRLFYDVLLDLGVHKKTALTLYLGVRAGSWYYW